MTNLNNTKEKMTEIGTKLRLTRESIGISQECVAKMIGKNQSFISRVETGRHKLLVLELLDFCIVYKKPSSYFIGDSYDE